MKFNKSRAKPVSLKSVIKEVRKLKLGGSIYNSEEGVKQQAQDQKIPLDEDGCRLVFIITKCDDKTGSFRLEKRRVKVS